LCTGIVRGVEAKRLERTPRFEDILLWLEGDDLLHASTDHMEPTVGYATLHGHETAADTALLMPLHQQTDEKQSRSQMLEFIELTIVVPSPANRYSANDRHH
jgi:hypothetical protein